MRSDVTEYADMLAKSINESVEARIRSVANNGAADWGDYRRRCGEIAALKLAFEAVGVTLAEFYRDVDESEQDSTPDDVR